MTGGLSTQVKVNVKPIGAFKSGLIRQVVFECRGLKIQGPLYFHDKKYTAYDCFRAILSCNTNNSILKSCAKWAVFSEPVTLL